MGEDLMKNKGVRAILLGFLAGMLNGLLGAGGGIVLVRGAESVLPRKYQDGRDIFANVLCVMLPLSAVSAIAYVLRGSVNGVDFRPFILPAVIGGVGGGMLLSVIDTRLLRLIFSALVVWSGFTMIF
jgi:uncharacterized membrane protein YfcA